MNIIYKKYAFTLAEGFVCFILMGLLFVASITHFRPKDNYNKLYYSAFNTLVQAVGNIELEWNPNCICSNEGKAMAGSTNGYEWQNETCFSEVCWSFHMPINGKDVRNEAQAGYRWSDHYRAYPGFLMGEPEHSNYDGIGTDKYFCKKLTSKINTLLEDSECKNFITLERMKSSLRTTAFTHATSFFELFPDLQPSFVAANGQRFYISSLVTANSLPAYHSDPEKGPDTMMQDYTYREHYRFVVVDLNGSKGPNTQFINGATDPDLVLFAINSKGRVIPLGIPEFDKLYIDAFIQYADGTKSNTMSLFQAKAQAWGVPYTEGESSKFMNQGLIRSNGLSYSHIFYHNAINCAIGESGKETYNSSAYTPYIQNSIGEYTRINNGGDCLKFENNSTGRFVEPLYTILVMQFLMHYEDCYMPSAQTFFRTDEGNKESECFPYYNFETPDVSLGLTTDVSKGCATEQDQTTNKCGVELVH